MISLISLGGPALSLSYSSLLLPPLTAGHHSGLTMCGSAAQVVLYFGTMRRLAIYSHVILVLGDATVGAMDDTLP